MNDPIAMLKKDHREAEVMLRALAASKPGARQDVQPLRGALVR